MQGAVDTDSRIRWRVSCTDPLGREAKIGIGIDGDRVVTIVPAPGDGMSFTAEQSRQASAAYAAASQFIGAAQKSTT